jgi:hypothetical protein
MEWSNAGLKTINEYLAACHKYLTKIITSHRVRPK